MNTPNARRGGLDVSAPSVVPPIGVDLSNEQALAVAFRHLAGIGFAENLAGHITWQPDGQIDMLVNPWGLCWPELTASDILRGRRRCPGDPGPVGRHPGDTHSYRVADSRPVNCDARKSPRRGSPASSPIRTYRRPSRTTHLVTHRSLGRACRNASNPWSVT